MRAGFSGGCSSSGIIYPHLIVSYLEIKGRLGQIDARTKECRLSTELLAFSFDRHFSDIFSELLGEQRALLIYFDDQNRKNTGLCSLARTVSSKRKDPVILMFKARARSHDTSFRSARNAYLSLAPASESELLLIGV